MANSHEGDLKKAKKIVEAASKAKADAIKFQKFFAEEEAEPGHENYSTLKKLEMNDTEWNELIKYSKRKQLKVFIDVDGVRSAKSIKKFRVDGYKIHTSDQSNPFLLDYLSKTNKPILLSSAGSNPNEISEILKLLKKTPKEIVIMHGYQGYPTKIDDLNLSRITELKNRFGHFIGISDHVSGNSKMAQVIPLIGFSLGASVIEKHINLDRSKKGTDYYSSLNPNEFKEFVSMVKNTYKSLGENNFNLSKDELIYRLKHKKNTITKKSIKKRTKLNDQLFEFKITKEKKDSVPFYEYRRRTASVNIPKGSILTKSMLNKKEKKVAAVIACRIFSNRLFAKPMQLIGNHNILTYLINQIKKSNLISDIVLGISEDAGNEIFINYAKKHEIKYILGNDLDVLKRLIDGAKYVDADIVFRVTSENPFIYWEAIDKLIKKHIENNLDYSTVLPIPLGSGFELINLRALEISHSKGTKRHRSEHCDLYIFENKKKFRIKIFKPEKLLQRSDIRLTVDTPQDLLVARLIQKNLGKNEKPIKLERIVRFLNKNPEIQRINLNKKMIKSYQEMILNLVGK